MNDVNIATLIVVIVLLALIEITLSGMRAKLAGIEHSASRVESEVLLMQARAIDEAKRMSELRETRALIRDALAAITSLTHSGLTSEQYGAALATRERLEAFAAKE